MFTVTEKFSQRDLKIEPVKIEQEDEMMDVTEDIGQIHLDSKKARKKKKKSKTEIKTES